MDGIGWMGARVERMAGVAMDDHMITGTMGCPRDHLLEMVVEGHECDNKAYRSSMVASRHAVRERRLDRGGASQQGRRCIKCCSKNGRCLEADQPVPAVHLLNTRRFSAPPPDALRNFPCQHPHAQSRQIPPRLPRRPRQTGLP